MSLIGRINALNGLLDNSKTTSDVDEPETALEKYQDFLEEEKIRREEELEKEKKKAEEKKEAEAKKAEELEKEKKEAELTNDQVQRYMSELRQSMQDNTLDTSEEKLSKITADNELSEKDFAKIIDLYKQKFGNGEKDNLINEIDNKLCGEHKNSVIGKAAEKLIGEAKDELENGNQNGEALQMLNESIQNSNLEKIGKSEEFLEAVMHKDNPTIIETLKEKYPEYDEEDIENNLQKTYSLYTEDNLIDIIDMYS